MTEKEIEEKYELVKVPTEHTLAIKNPSGEIMTQEYAMVEILNILNEIKKVIK